MKTRIKDFSFGFIICLVLVVVVGVSATVLFKATDITFTPSDASWNVTNVEEALSDLKTYQYDKNKMSGASWIFDYTGGEQTFEIPGTGTYKLELWGASGGNGNSTYIGGYGAYSVGEIKLNKSDILYINVGGKGSTGLYVAGGYNGGGASGNQLASGGSGGGATHIALKSGLLSTLENDKDKVLIVAGSGGGGGYYTSSEYGKGGNGGGIKGNSSTASKGSGYLSSGGTQTSGGYATNFGDTAPYVGTFGAGGYMYNTGQKISGGGGAGWYGGGFGADYGAGGGGGSSYIGNSNLTNKSMYCYSCTTSSDESTKTISNTCVSETATSECSKTGNGYAKITLISLD